MRFVRFHFFTLIILSLQALDGSANLHLHVLNPDLEHISRLLLGVRILVLSPIMGHFVLFLSLRISDSGIYFPHPLLGF